MGMKKNRLSFKIDRINNKIYVFINCLWWHKSINWKAVNSITYQASNILMKSSALLYIFCCSMISALVFPSSFEIVILHLYWVWHKYKYKIIFNVNYKSLTAWQSTDIQIKHKHVGKLTQTYKSDFISTYPCSTLIIYHSLRNPIITNRNHRYLWRIAKD